ncbi:unnamed protein product [Auanema sp. JU1783]|nr:unnamed protein product [Auanema sp. JU1783]
MRRTNLQSGWLHIKHYNVFAERLFRMFLLILMLHLAFCDICPSVLNSKVLTFGKDNNKCLYIINEQNYCSARTYCSQQHLDLVTIDSAGENAQVQALLLFYNHNKAFIGYISNGTQWLTSNGSLPDYERFTSGNPASCGTTLSPSLTTVPGPRRRPTDIVFVFDASMFSSFLVVGNQVYFAELLATHVYARGSARFAYTFYGCDQIQNTYWLPYDGFVKNLKILNETLAACVRTKPTTLENGLSNLVTNYYSINPVKGEFYKYMAAIFFSSCTNSSWLAIGTPTAPVNSELITIAIGSSATSLSRISNPNGNSLRIPDFSAMTSLVQNVDNKVFDDNLLRTAASAVESTNVAQSDSCVGADRLCAYIDDTGNWYSVNCTEHLYALCLGKALPYVAPTGPPDTDPCIDEFTYYSDLENDYCYKVDVKKTYSDSQDDCVPDVFIRNREIALASIQSESENQNILSLVKNSTGVSAFWIGLNYLPGTNEDCTNVSNLTVAKSCWQWENGEEITYLNFKSDYPRLGVSEFNCVAMLFETGQWITTDCSNKLPPVCSYSVSS